MSKIGTRIIVDAIPFHFPTKAHETDAAYDLYNAKDVEAVSNTRAYVPLGFKIVIGANSCICQGRIVYVPQTNLITGLVNGTRSGLGSTDK